MLAANRRARCLILTLSIALGGCERKVLLYEATNLREEITPVTNEHVIKLDVIMSQKDWKRVSDLDTLLQYTDC